jgi:pimeloyl-ACP methyl ester carboxylesterase
MPLPNPVIVVPGVTASYLDDRYQLPPETIWSVLTKKYERAALHPDNLRFEASEPAVVRGGQIFEIAYRELVEELRYNLKERDDWAVPVFPFGYDWRQPLETTASELIAFADEVAERTSLLRHYHRDGYEDRKRVNFVGHSMGGLVVMSYIHAAGQKSRAEKVVTLATPYRGSFEAVIKITTGTANLGTAAPSSREREAARMTPSLYYLLPDIPEAIDADEGIPKSLFNPDAWQPSIVDTIEEYIRLHGQTATNEAERKEQAQKAFADFLRTARSARRKLKKFDLAAAGLTEEDWLCVVGVNSVTRVGLKIQKLGRAPDFAFSRSDRDDRWVEGQQEHERMQTGDGTVPLQGALPHFLPNERVICVRPDDFGYWEIADKLALKAGGFHGLLPNMDMLHQLDRALLQGQGRSPPKYVGRAAPWCNEGGMVAASEGRLEPSKPGRLIRALTMVWPPLRATCARRRRHSARRSAPRRASTLHPTDSRQTGLPASPCR